MSRLLAWARRLVAAFRPGLTALPETLFLLALLAGWGLVTWAAAGAAGSWVWKLAAGLLCWSACGWRMVRVFVLDGLYGLWKASREEAR